MQQRSSSFCVTSRYARSTHDHVGVSVRHSAWLGHWNRFFSFYLFISKLNDYGFELGFLNFGIILGTVTMVTMNSKVTFAVLNINLLLAECEVRMTSYGPSFFLPLITITRKENTRIHNLPYGLSKRG